MALYCGIDLHAKKKGCCGVGWAGQGTVQKRLPDDLVQIVATLQPFRQDLAVELAYNWYWLVDGLTEAGYPVHLAHAAAVPQYAGIKYTNDERNAPHLAHLLCPGFCLKGISCRESSVRCGICYCQDKRRCTT